MCDCGLRIKTSFLANAEHLPTGLGVMLETIRESGRYNMLTEFQKAFLEAICLGVYLGQLTSAEVNNIVANEMEVMVEYITANLYQCPKYNRLVKATAQALPFSNAYERKINAYHNNGALYIQSVPKVAQQQIPALDLCVEKALKACLKKGKFARDVVGIEAAQTTNETQLRLIGAQLWI